MVEIINHFKELLTNKETIGQLVQTAVYLLLVLPAFYILSRLARRFFTNRFNEHAGMIGHKAVLYAGIAFVVVAIMKIWSLPINHLLGAAGIVGLAIGFASQTSVSNVISGVFLLTEKPFKVGDVITIGANTGVVLSIDTLSVKLRLFDNKLVRIPNETIIKSELTNITHFPIRRVDTTVGVAYKEDIGKVRDILLSIANDHPVVLQDPPPLVIFTGYGASSVDMLFAVWTRREDFLTVKNGMMEEIKKRFDQEGVEIPFPHVSLYAGSATEPFPVRVVGSESRDNDKV